MGFSGSQSTVKRYIAAHKHLIPAKRQLVAAQGNRGRRYVTKPGEAYQMIGDSLMFWITMGRPTELPALL